MPIKPPGKPTYAEVRMNILCFIDQSVSAVDRGTREDQRPSNAATVESL